MKATLLTLLISFFVVKCFGQTVYSDDQVIKISDYLTELEKRDSIIKSVLAGIDENLPGQGNSTQPKTVNICGKLTGLNKSQFPITDINLMLVKDNGETLTQKTSN